MEYTILVVEPDLLQGKEIVRTLVRAGYDAIVASGADEALRQLYQVHPDAVVFGNGLPVDELSQLSERIATVCDLPLISLDNSVPSLLAAQQLVRSATVEDLPSVLDRLLGGHKSGSARFYVRE
jgi:CheY-like chemotaxis protein